MKTALFGKISNLPKIIKEVNYLLSKLFENDFEVFVESAFYSYIKDGHKKSDHLLFVLEKKSVPVDLDLFISLGGDGTILRSVKYVEDSGVPIIGINFGKLGFLSTIQREDIDVLIENIKTHQLKIVNRSLIQIVSPTVKTPYALNEITVSRKGTASMITINTSLDQEHLSTYWADGLIVSTPTGSTGYSLSCGGPIIDPQSDVLVITPIAPHNLNARPLVIPDKTSIKLNVNGREKSHLVSLDSRIITIKNNTNLVIEKAPFQIKLVELRTEGFIKTIRKKLLWGEDRRN